MLTALRVGNFKAFGATQTLPIKPITLIFGANSSGKSSLLHALCLAHESNRTGNLDVFRTELGGDAVDLGGIRQYVHRHDVSKRIELTINIDTKSFRGRMSEILAPVGAISISLTLGVRLDDFGQPISGAKPVIDSYSLEGDGRFLLRASRRADGHFRLDRVEREHPVLRHLFSAMVLLGTTSEAVSAEDFEVLDEAIAELLPSLVLQGGRLVPAGLEKAGEGSVRETGLLFPVSRGKRREDLAAALRLFLPRSLDELFSGLREEVNREFERMHYLGPLRSYPPRHLAFLEGQNGNWKAGGGFAWDTVRRDPEVRKAVNTWLGSDWLQTKYELRLREFVSDSEISQVLEDKIAGLFSSLSMQLAEEVVDGDMIEQLEAAKGKYHETVGTAEDTNEIASALVDVSEIIQPSPDAESLAESWAQEIVRGAGDALTDLVLIDKRTETAVSHRDVGIGVSQVLPVLVLAFGSKDQLIAIEQPEIHLHPALQSELADVFIESALGERSNRFILETHSEHFILRLMRRMRETFRGKRGSNPRVTVDNIAILFVAPGPNGSLVQELRLKPDGSLLDPWPGGFFEEGFNELFS
jgi:hypothetical protein